MNSVLRVKDEQKHFHDSVSEISGVNLYNTPGKKDDQNKIE